VGIHPEDEVKLSREEYEELLSLIPAYRRGELTPSVAHKISLLLEENEAFALDAAREEAIVETFLQMKADPLPRGLVSHSVRSAVGEAASASWLSLDTLLIALGVGTGAAGISQFVAGKINLLPWIGQQLGSLAGVAIDQSLGTVLGAVTLGSLGLVVGGVAWAVRLLRTN
jgi:anti-sigma factor RsiW